MRVQSRHFKHQIDGVASSSKCEQSQKQAQVERVLNDLLAPLYLQLVSLKNFVL